ncbi:hypothetical protein [Variovorax sp. PBL-E5]|uniref:hypothetical protein n=1 Tax=Variovorax sp. PBL-E5 TaxID=434014 RepID=UPI001317B563|nr:hypothetical protein [Variovorax sp. PBL-E5]VTU29852.1 hypothetical protein E5CHR_02895 [Variovorax sp. PBL-E5]
MSRVQVSDQFGGQQLQTHARPVATAVQAAAPDQETRWKGLADAFAQGAGLADTVRQQAEIDDRNAAKRWAQSMTVGELGKAIQDGKMLPSQSPVFVGTVQHIWGVNSHEAGMRDLTSKLTTGELKFNSPAEADNYLTEWRNTTLAGQSDYAKAGFDKAYAQTRDKVMDHVSKINDATWVDNAKAQASDFLANSLNEVSGPDFKGTPQEAASALMQQYQLMRHTKTLPDDAAKGALGEMVTRMAGAGKPDLLAAFLDSEMDGIGSVRGFLGETRAATLTHQAAAAYDQGQRERIDGEMLPWYKQADAGSLNVSKLEAWAASPENAKFVSSATVHSLTRANAAAIERQQRELQQAQIVGAMQASEYEAQRRVDAAASAGRLWEVQGTRTPKVLTKTGEVKDFDVKGYAEQSLGQMTNAMPFGQQVSAWAMNGLDNPNWRNEINAGFLNLASIGVDSQGKPKGTLNEAGKRSIELFKQIDGTNPDYARQLVGEKTYQRFYDIGFLMHLGRSADDAAGLAGGAASGAVVGSDVDKLTKKIHAEVNKLTDSPWYKPNWVTRITGDNTTANTAQVTGALRRYSTLLAHSGQYGDAEAAVSEAFGYLARPEVSAKINGTLYLRSELPTAPATRTPDEWFSRYLDAVPKARARELGQRDSDVRLEFDPTIKAYRAFVLGIPLSNPDGTLMVSTKGDIAAWYAQQLDRDVAEATAKGAAKVQAIKDTRAAGAQISEWAKTEFGKGIPKVAAKPAAPEEPFRAQPLIDMNGITNPNPNARPGQRQL